MDWAVYTLDFTQEGRRRVNLFSYVWPDTARPPPDVTRRGPTGSRRP